MDHRQGRHHPRPARLGDHRGHRADARPSCYRDLTERYGDPAYARVDTPATREQKAALAKLSPEQVPADELAGEKITATLTTAPGNGAAIGGLKVVTESGWFAARPSGTEDVYKLYAESFRGPEHLAAIQDEARAIIANAIGGELLSSYAAPATGLMQRDGAPPQRSTQGRAARQQILDSVIALLAQRGVDRASLRTVGEAIGVSHTALRHYFSSRDELLVEAYRAHEARAAARGARGRASAPSAACSSRQPSATGPSPAWSSCTPR